MGESSGDGNGDKDKKTKKNRCHTCRKKVGLTGVYLAIPNMFSLSLSLSLSLSFKKKLYCFLFCLGAVLFVCFDLFGLNEEYGCV